MSERNVPVLEIETLRRDWPKPWSSIGCELEYEGSFDDWLADRRERLLRGLEDIRFLEGGPFAL